SLRQHCAISPPAELPGLLRVAEDVSTKGRAEMSVPAGTHANDEIARVAHAIWEAEGQPEGRDHEHWMRARQLIEEGRAEIEFPQTAAPRDVDAHAPRPVQPGFEDAAPGMVPVMRDEPEEELRE